MILWVLFCYSFIFLFSVLYSLEQWREFFTKEGVRFSDISVPTLIFFFISQFFFCVILLAVCFLFLFFLFLFAFYFIEGEKGVEKAVRGLKIYLKG